LWIVERTGVDICCCKSVYAIGGWIKASSGVAWCGGVRRGAAACGVQPYHSRITKTHVAVYTGQHTEAVSKREPKLSDTQQATLLRDSKRVQCQAATMMRPFGKGPFEGEPRIEHGNPGYNLPCPHAAYMPPPATVAARTPPLRLRKPRPSPLDTSTSTPLCTNRMCLDAHTGRLGCGEASLPSYSSTDRARPTPWSRS